MRPSAASEMKAATRVWMKASIRMGGPILQTNQERRARTGDDAMEKRRNEESGASSGGWERRGRRLLLVFALQKYGRKVVTGEPMILSKGAAKARKREREKEKVKGERERVEEKKS